MRGGRGAQLRAAHTGSAPPASLAVVPTRAAARRHGNGRPRGSAGGGETPCGARDGAAPGAGIASRVRPRPVRGDGWSRAAAPAPRSGRGSLCCTGPKRRGRHAELCDTAARGGERRGSERVVEPRAAREPRAEGKMAFKGPPSDSGRSVVLCLSLGRSHRAASRFPRGSSR